MMRGATRRCGLWASPGRQRRPASPGIRKKTRAPPPGCTSYCRQVGGCIARSYSFNASADRWLRNERKKNLGKLSSACSSRRSAGGRRRVVLLMASACSPKGFTTKARAPEVARRDAGPASQLHILLSRGAAGGVQRQEIIVQWQRRRVVTLRAQKKPEKLSPAYWSMPLHRQFLRRQSCARKDAALPLPMPSNLSLHPLLSACRCSRAQWGMPARPASSVFRSISTAGEVGS
jgi:hypothetical protein